MDRLPALRVARDRDLVRLVAIPLFPEEASAFSLEDLYSNLLGIKLAGSLMYQGAVVSEASYKRT